MNRNMCAWRALACALALPVLVDAQVMPRTLTEMDLSLLGVSATLETLAPVVPKGIPSGVRVSVRAGARELDANEVREFLGGPFEVQGELSGPGLPGTITLPEGGAPAADVLALALPPIPVAGTYELDNLRLVVGGRVALDVEPRRVSVRVIDQVLVTQVKTRPLTLDEIRSRGIVLDRDDYLGFEFTLGLRLDSQTVSLNFPVVFDRQGVEVPLTLMPPGPPLREGVPVPRLRPVLLAAAGDDENGPGAEPPKLELPSGEPVRIPALLVIPGDVGYLKQFFSAKLYVANGAPQASGLTVHDVRATIKLPAGPDGDPTTLDDNPLALPELLRDGQVVVQPLGMDVRGVGPDGEPGTPDDVGTLGPTEQGEAEFLLRGEAEGFHAIEFELAAVLEGLTQPDGSVAPIRVKGSASGGVLVRNPYFDLTFTVPASVREHETFSVFVTVVNIGQGTANDFTLNLDGQALSGLTLVTQAGNTPTRNVPTLRPRDAKTFEYKFRSQRTGQVIAKYLRLEGSDASGSQGRLKFSLGLGERGVPLSPDTLVLPSAVDALPPEVVAAAMRVLGQAWSVAKARTLPAGVLATSEATVVTKALALAEAGLRVTLGQSQGEALRDLLFDFWGAPVERGFDQLLRTTEAGSDLARVLGLHLAPAVSAAGGALDYADALSEVAASGPDFVAFAVDTGAARLADVALIDALGRVTSVPAEAWLPSSDVPAALLAPLGPGESAPLLGLLGAPAGVLLIELRGRDSGSAGVTVSLPAGDGERFRRVRLTGLELRPGSRTLIALDTQQPGQVLVSQDQDGDGQPDGAPQEFATTTFESLGPRLLAAAVIGPETLSGASPFGLHAALVFDRAVDASSAAKVENYELEDNDARFARRQLSGRLVFLQLARPEGEYVARRLRVSQVSDPRGHVGPLRDVPLATRIGAPGGIVSGRVLTADGQPQSAGRVVYLNTPDGTDECFTPPAQFEEASRSGLAEVPLDVNGRYELRYVRQNLAGCAFYVITSDPVTGAQRHASARVRGAGDRLVLDIVLLGRGAVAGVVRNRATGQPVAGARVTALSTTDTQSGGTAVADVLGRFHIAPLTVGPVSVHAAKGTGSGFAAGRIYRAGDTATVDVELDDSALDVSGAVSKFENGTTSPAAGALVVFRLGGADLAWQYADTAGAYRFRGMPSGHFTVRAYYEDLSAARDGDGFAGHNVSGHDLLVQVPPVGERHDVVGHVVQADGSPAENALVWTDSPGQPAALTDASGAFRLRDVSVPNPPRSLTASARSADGRRTGSAHFQLTTTAQLPPDVEIALSGLGEATFTALGPQGAPVVGLEVALPGACGNPCGCIARTTDAQGKVTFQNLPVGPVRAQAFWDRHSYVDFATALAVVPGDGQTGFGVLRFNGAGSVRVKVTDETGDPVGASDVTLSASRFKYDPLQQLCGLATVPLTQRTSITGATPGEVRFDNVLLGAYGVRATNPFAVGALVGAQGTLTQPGQVAAHVLVTRDVMAGVLSGRVFFPDGSTPAPGVRVTATGPVPDVTVTTDALGAFHFARVLPAGTYRLTARDPDVLRGGAVQETVVLGVNQNATLELRLLGRGSVVVKVVDGAGAALARAQVTLRETRFPNGVYERVIQAGESGTTVFDRVYEGALSIEVKDSFGRGGRVAATLPGPDQSIEVLLRVTPTGCLVGRFRLPSGEPIPNGVVKLLAGPYAQVVGQVTTPGAGSDVGAFAFDYVPLGDVRLEAQDPLTARTGLAAGALTIEGHQGSTPPVCLTLDVQAEGLGTVHGVVTSNDLAQPGIEVELASGRYRARTFSGGQGEYRVEGVPVGQVTATARAPLGSPLTGSASGALLDDGGELTLDVPLRDSVDVAGRLFRAGGSQQPAPIAELRVSGGPISPYHPLKTFSASDGTFRFERLPVGLLSFDADVLQSVDQGRTSAELARQSPPAPVQVDVTLNGVGRLRGTALDSQGQPVAGQVWITGTGAFPYQHFLQVGSDGRFEIPEILAGPLSVKLSARPGGVQLYGTRAAQVDPEGTTDVSVQLEPSGTVRGRALRSDGTTPAYGAEVWLRRAGAFATRAVADTAGVFVLQGVPLGAAAGDVRDPVSGGLALLEERTLTSNGELIDYGDVLLDDTPVRVVSLEPQSGAQNVPVQQPLRVTFSDALASAVGVVARVGATALSATATLSADRRTVTLVGTWPDARDVTLAATTAVRDALGRPLAAEVTSTFRTVDLTPPVVVQVTPANLALQVPSQVVARVTYGEPLAVTGTLSLSGPSGVIPANVTFEPPATLALAPQAPLPTDAVFTLRAQGAVDLAGNAQTAAFTSSFKTLDTLPPTLALSAPAAGGWSAQTRPSIVLALADALSGIDAPTALMQLDGAAVAATASSTALTFTPAAPLADGQHALSASVRDRAGNLGTLAASFGVDSLAPGAATLVGVADGQTVSGNVTLSATSVETGSGLARIDFFRNGVLFANAGAGQAFSVAWNTSGVADGEYLLAARGVDVAGNVGPLGPARRVVVDNHVLAIGLTSPNAGAVVRDQVSVAATVDEPVLRVDFQAGALPVVSDDAAPYAALLDVSTAPEGILALSATAVGLAPGETATAGRSVTIDRTPPAPPDVARVHAESDGISALIVGQPGATEPGARVDARNVDTGALGFSAPAASDGSFALRVDGVLGQTLELRASDVAGNQSAPATLTIDAQVTQDGVPLTGLALWVQADKDVLVDVAGRVAQWLDQSGNANHLSQATAAARPALVAEAAGGHPVLRFDGVDDFLQFGTRFNQNIRTLVAVVRGSTPGEHFLLGDSATFNTTDFYPGTTSLWSTSSSALVREAQTSINGAAVNGLVDPRPTTLAIVTVVVNAAPGAAVTGVSADRLFRHAVQNRAWPGDAAELLIYDRPLPASDQQAVEDYLARKYALYAPRVGAPLIAPDGGSFSGSTTVTLSSRTPGALITYTLDGSEPDAASTPYSGPLTLVTSTTVKARAFRAGFPDSASSSAGFVRDEEFSPRSFGPDLLLWVRADAGLARDGGGRVKAWKDQSGRGNDLTQWASSLQPRVAPQTQNGVALLRFDGLDDFMQFGSRLGDAVGSVFLVLREAAPQTGERFLLGDSAAFNTTHFWPGTSTLWSASSSAGVTLGATFIDGQPINGLVERRDSPTGGLAKVALLSFVSDGRLLSADRVFRHALHNRPWAGDVAEVVIFGRPLGAAERRAVEDYLLAKYRTVPASASAPTASPNGGAFSGTVTVSLSTTTTGAELRYTLDGSEPDAGSPLYEGPLTLTASTTVKAKALRVDLLPSVTTVAGFVNTADFSPTSLADLELWVRPDAGLPPNGGRVDLWLDQSGRGNHLRQPQGAFAPLLVPGAAGGYPAARFDGVDDFMFFTRFDARLRSAFLVLRESAPQTGERFLFGDASAFNTTHFWPGSASLWSSSSSPGVTLGSTFVNGVPISPLSDPRSSPSVGLANLAVLSLVSDGRGLSADRVFRHALHNRAWPGDLAELIVYSRQLGAAERRAVEDYLMAKYRSVPATANTPTISPNGGLFTGTQSVTLQSATPGAEIHYTLDGGDPDQASALYAGPLTLSATTTLRARAFRADLLPSAPSAAGFIASGDFAPPQLAGLRLWVRADAGLPPNAGRVDRWVDQSPLAQDVTQPQGAFAPLMVPGAHAGLPVVRFDGLDDFLLLTRLDASARSLFVVLREAAPQSGERFLFGDSATFNTTHFWPGATTLWSTSTSSAIRAGVTRVDGVTVNGLLDRRDAGPASLADVSVLSIVTDGAGVSTDRFGRHGVHNRAWAGDVLEIVVYDRVLSAAERASLEQYLGARYGIAVQP